MSPPSSDSWQHYRTTLLRGTAFNVVGAVGRSSELLFVLVSTWLFGPAVMGVYMLEVMLAEVAVGLVAAGCTDAVTIRASHHADAAAHEEGADRALYRVLATAFLIGLGAALALAVAVQLGLGDALTAFFPKHRDLLPGLYFIAWSVPLQTFTLLAVASTKARMRMDYDALIGGLIRPGALFAGGYVAWHMQAGASGLAMAYAASFGMTTIASAYAFARHFSFKKLGVSMARLDIERGVLSFAIPQSLNLTFNRYITRLDTIMLASFGHAPAQVAYYATASLLTSNLRQVRVVFSGALAPVAARFHATRATAALEQTLGTLTRWITSIIVPLVLVLAACHAEILRWVDPQYAGHRAFVVLLLVPPLVGSAFGLAGNCLVYTGHSRWNLLNSFVVAIVNTGLNWMLIPLLGLTGAALATAVATSLITGLQLFELRWLEHIRIPWRAVYKPHVGLWVGVLAFLPVWKLVHEGGSLERWTVAAGLVLTFVGTMLALRHEELLSFLRSFAAPSKNSGS